MPSSFLRLGDLLINVEAIRQIKIVKGPKTSQAVELMDMDGGVMTFQGSDAESLVTFIHSHTDLLEKKMLGFAPKPG